MRVFGFSVVLLSLVWAGPASATSGWGCYRVNVGPADPLAVRALPSANSAALTQLSWQDQPIIALDGLTRGEDSQASLFDVHRAEFSECTPDRLPLGARWCPVSIFSGDDVVRGWIKRRFVDHSECP